MKICQRPRAFTLTVSRTLPIPINLRLSLKQLDVEYHMSKPYSLHFKLRTSTSVKGTSTGYPVENILPPTLCPEPNPNFKILTLAFQTIVPAF